MHVQARSGSLDESANAVTDVQTVQEGLEGVGAMGSGPLELDGTSVSEGVDANAVAAEGGGDGFGFGLDAEDVRENVSANGFSADLEEIFAVGFESFNFD